MNLFLRNPLPSAACPALALPRTHTHSQHTMTCNWHAARVTPVSPAHSRVTDSDFHAGPHSAVLCPAVRRHVGVRVSDACMEDTGHGFSRQDFQRQQICVNRSDLISLSLRSFLDLQVSRGSTIPSALLLTLRDVSALGSLVRADESGAVLFHVRSKGCGSGGRHEKWEKQCRRKE